MATKATTKAEERKAAARAAQERKVLARQEADKKKKDKPKSKAPRHTRKAVAKQTPSVAHPQDKGTGAVTWSQLLSQGKMPVEQPKSKPAKKVAVTAAPGRDKAPASRPHTATTPKRESAGVGGLQL
jgi:hypothetical protein